MCKDLNFLEIVFFFLSVGLFSSVYTSSSLSEPRKKSHSCSRIGCHSHLHSVCVVCA